MFEAAADAPVGGKLCTLSAKPLDAAENWSGRFEQKIPLVVGPPNNAVYYETSVDKLAVAVAKEAPFTLRIEEPRVPLAQGGQMELHVTAQRQAGFEKPISLQLLDQPQGIGARGQVQIAAQKTEAALQLSASAQARVGKYPLIVLGWADDDGKVWVASEPQELEVSQPYVNIKIEMAAAEQGQTAAVACTIEDRLPFEGKAKAELLGLPAGATAAAQEFTASDKRLVFEVAVDAKCPPGHNKSLFCRVTVMKDGQAIVQDLAHGGDLRIDAKTPAPQGAPAAPKAPATVQPQSRLDKLRQEQNGQ
jgi:hypothetical protein